MRFVADWSAWALPLAIALAILWDGRRKPNTLSMAVGWTVAEIHGAFNFQAGFRGCAIVGVFAVTVACLPGLFRVLAQPAPAVRPVSGAIHESRLSLAE